MNWICSSKWHMKTRVFTIIILLLILTVLLTRNNERISHTLLSFINPIKQNYRTFTQEIENTSQSYLFQQQTIETLRKENRVLHKLLLEQSHYLDQVKSIYDVLPHLRKEHLQTIAISETISYIKLNSFSQIILTQPEGLFSNKLYGLIQGDVVAGISEVKNNQLYGYLTSDNKCRFSVFIGKDKAPGIAIGVTTHQMIIKFIPKWYQIQTGDKVTTSGLDNIFFTDLPVGIVTKVEVQSSYKVAYIETYNDVLHPKTFFLIADAKKSLATYFEANLTHPQEIPPQLIPSVDKNETEKKIVSKVEPLKPKASVVAHRIDQTQIDLIEPEIPMEPHSIKKVKVKKKSPIPKRKIENFDTLDLF